MDKFGFGDTEDSMAYFEREGYKKPVSDEFGKDPVQLLKKIVSLLSKQNNYLQMLVNASETELVSLRYNSGLQNLSIAVFDQPTDPDNTTPTNGGYTVLNIQNILNRTSPELYFQNEGPGTIYVRVLKSKTDSLTEESVLYEGEYDVYYDVFELRFRTTTANTHYRISEYEPGKHRDLYYKRGLSYVSETNVAIVGTPNTENVVTHATKGLGRFVTTGYIVNDGPGNLKVEVSIDGTNYGDIITLIPNQILEFEEETYSLRIDATINATAYRLNVH